jgi:hypothetical protein
VPSRNSHMRIIHRRGFMKTLIAAAVTSPLYARLSPAAALLATEKKSASASDTLQMEISNCRCRRVEAH